MICDKIRAERRDKRKYAVMRDYFSPALRHGDDEAAAASASALPSTVTPRQRARKRRGAAHSAASRINSMVRWQRRSRRARAPRYARKRCVTRARACHSHAAAKDCKRQQLHTCCHAPAKPACARAYVMYACAKSSAAIRGGARHMPSARRAMQHAGMLKAVCCCTARYGAVAALQQPAKARSSKMQKPQRSVARAQCQRRERDARSPRGARLRALFYEHFKIWGLVILLLKENVFKEGREEMRRDER